MSGRAHGQLGCCLGAGLPPPAAGARGGACCDGAPAAAAAARLQLHGGLPNGSRWRSTEDLTSRRPARLSLMRCHGTGSAGSTLQPRSAQQRRAAFSARRDDSAPAAMEAPLVACLLDRAPSVVVSDYSHTNSTEEGGGAEDYWPPVLDGSLVGRRLSTCSSCSCSTVSSCGRGLSRRGSLVDLEAEGLVQCGDGRLERARSADTGRRARRSLERQGSLDMDCGGALAPWQRSLDLEWSQHTLHPAWTASIEPWRRSLEPPAWHLGRQRSLDLDLDAPEATAPSANQRPDEPTDPANQRCDLPEGRGRTLAVAPEPAVSDPTRKVSDCSCSSVSTISQEDEDEIRSTCTVEEVTTHRPKPSQWRKVKGVVQWTPFVQTYKKQKYLWVQLAGHQGNFRAGEEGTIQKRLCGREQECLKDLMLDPLRPYVPEYRGQIVTEDGEDFLQLQDLLGEFESPCVMDCKIGVRTYQEDELAKAKEKPKLRKDMYDKMMLIDKSAPTEEEHRLKAVTKPRYMVWRETISSTANLGFRIEGIRKSEGFSSKDFKTTRTREQVKEAVTMFTQGYPDAVRQYLDRLQRIRDALSESHFFKTHEFIGSSLLFVHDASRASVWMIDFAKTTPLPAGVHISHSAAWSPGNHEDGYLTGVTSLMSILQEMATEAASS